MKGVHAHDLEIISVLTFFWVCHHVLFRPSFLNFTFALVVIFAYDYRNGMAFVVARLLISKCSSVSWRHDFEQSVQAQSWIYFKQGIRKKLEAHYGSSCCLRLVCKWLHCVGERSDETRKRSTGAHKTSIKSSNQSEHSRVCFTHVCKSATEMCSTLPTWGNLLQLGQLQNRCTDACVGSIPGSARHHGQIDGIHSIFPERWSRSSKLLE